MVEPYRVPPSVVSTEAEFSRFMHDQRIECLARCQICIEQKLSTKATSVNGRRRAFVFAALALLSIGPVGLVLFHYSHESLLYFDAIFGHVLFVYMLFLTIQAISYSRYYRRRGDHWKFEKLAIGYDKLANSAKHQREFVNQVIDDKFREEYAGTFLTNREKFDCQYNPGLDRLTQTWGVIIKLIQKQEKQKTYGK